MSRRTTVIIATVAVLTIIVAAVALRTERRSDPPMSMVVPVALDPAMGVDVAFSRPVGPTGERHGVPVGWRHDAAGAAAAASAYVTAGGQLAHLGPLSRRDVILTLATPAYGEALARSVNSQLDDLLFALGERGAAADGLVFSEYPLALRQDTDGPDRTRVQVWSVLVVAAKSGSVPRQLWRTATLTLAWSNDDWKVDRWETTTGPTPAPPPELEVSTVAAVADATSWVPATRPGGS